MAMLIHLPRDVWCNHIASFLKLQEFVRTDSAMCNLRDRQTYLSNVIGCGHFPVMSLDEEEIEMLRWYCSRNIFPESITFRAAFVYDPTPFKAKLLRHARSVIFEEDSIHESEDLDQLLEPCSKFLLELSIIDCRVVQIEAVRCCANLISLCLENCHEISDQALITCLEGCPQLQRCSIRQCTSISPYGLPSIPKNCPKLQSLELIGYHLLTELFEGIIDPSKMLHLHIKECTLGDEALWPVVHLMSQLRTFRINSPYQNLDDEDVETLCRNCHHLKVLELSNCTGLSHLSIHAISVYLQDLEELTLSKCSAVSNFSLFLIADGCKQLRFLDVSYNQHIFEGEIRRIGTNCNSLTNLDVSFCAHLTDAAFTTTLNSSVLKYLNLSGTRIEGSFLPSLLGGETSLLTLDCSNCGSLRSDFAASMTANTTLQVLNLSSTNLTKFAWMALSLLFPRIKHVNALYCNRVNGDVVALFRAHTTVKKFEVYEPDEEDFYSYNFNDT